MLYSKSSSGASSKVSSGGGGGTPTASSDYFVKENGAIEYPLQEIYASNFASEVLQKLIAQEDLKMVFGWVMVL